MVFWSTRDAGASPLFFPEFEQAGQARTELLTVVRKSPRALGFERSRWTLSMLLEVCSSWLNLETESGLSQLLDRLSISFTRGREHLESPDEHFDEKREYIADCQRRAEGDDSGRVRLLYLDELLYYGHPTIAPGWEAKGKQPLARRAGVPHTRHRVLAAMEHTTARTFFRQAPSIGTDQIVALYDEIYRAFPGADQIIVVQDNWPTHFHPKVFEPLVKQQWPWRFETPGNWPEAEPVARSPGEIPIQIVALPTYASWLNPIEKLWRWLKQDVLHMHPFSGQWDRLKQAVDQFLGRFDAGSKRLLNYVGLYVG